MEPIPEDVAELVRKRTEARAARDFGVADSLRAQIEARGFIVRDTPTGSSVEPKPPFEVVEPKAIPNRLADDASLGFSFHLLYEGFPGDLTRFLDSFAVHNQTGDVEIVIVDPASGDGETIEREAVRHDAVRTLHLDRWPGWASARNAGLKTSRADLIALVDLSIEPTGDILTPLVQVFGDPTVGVAGPFGLVSHDLREFQPSAGPEVHAVEGYLLVARRSSFARALIDERFTWYRNADIDLSFQIRAEGARAVVVDLPLVRHEHRGWDALSEAERDARSRRNHGLFLRRWKDRLDLVQAARKG